MFFFLTKKKKTRNSKTSFARFNRNRIECNFTLRALMVRLVHVVVVVALFFFAFTRITNFLLPDLFSSFPSVCIIHQSTKYIIQNTRKRILYNFFFYASTQNISILMTLCEWSRESWNLTWWVFSSKRR